MKKFAVMIVFLLLLAGAVFADKKAEPSGSVPLHAIPSEGREISFVRPAELSAETKRIISVLGMNQVQVFDLARRNESPVITHVWAERFENGVRNEDLINFGTGASAGRDDQGDIGQLIVTYHFQKNEEEKERVLFITASVADDRGSSSVTSETALPNDFEFRMMMPLNGERELRLNEPVTVMTVIEDGGNGIGFSGEELFRYDETGEVPELVRKYDRVFLFRVMLEEE